MAAPKGNKFWKLRSKHGRDKLFSSPEMLWDAACEYFQWCDDNPLLEETIQKIKIVGIGDKITREDLPKMRPYTLHGLCLYLDCSTSYFRAFKSTLNKNDKDFLTVITRIEETIYNHKFIGAASGFLNPNIIARDLGLSDKQEIDHTTDGQSLNEKPDFSKLSKDDLAQYIALQRKLKGK